MTVFSHGCVFAISLAALVYASDRLVEAMVSVARLMNVSKMTVGLTVVAIGTSLPELTSSVVAGLDGRSGIAIGNVIGSNICNVGLILGLTALFYRVHCERRTILREGSLMLFVSGSLWALASFEGRLSRELGAVLVAGFFGFIYWVLKNGRSMGEEFENWDSGKGVGNGSARGVLFWSVVAGVSFAVVIASSGFLVNSTVALAEEFGISENVIALSLIAFGTSLPELSVSIASAGKNQGDILVGNILGSNLCNILLVLGAVSIIDPLEFDLVSVEIDLPLLVLFALLMVWFLFRKKGISRGGAVAMLLLYFAFVWRCVALPMGL